MIRTQVPGKAVQVCVIGALLLTAGRAQSVALALSPGSGTPGSIVNLGLSVASTVTAPASLEWTVTYSTTDVAAFSVTSNLGTATITCNNKPGTSTCVAWNMNSNTISTGLVATLALTISPSTKSTSSTIQVSNGGASSLAGSALPVSTTGTTVAIAVPPVITSATSASGTVGLGFSYQITASNSPTSYGASGLPGGVSINTSTGLISGIPTTAATFTVIISAMNSGGAGTATLTLMITGSQPPMVGASTPGGGSGFSQAFTFTFSDGAGWQALGVLDILISGALDGRHACYIAYVVPSSSLLLVDDAGDTGGPFAALQLNGSGSVSNSQCTISAAGSSVTGSGNTLTLTLNLSFSPSFAGNKVIYMAARDTGTGNSGWQAMGTWGVPGSATSGPAVAGMSPARSTSLAQTYTFTFTDNNGWQDIGIVDVLINSALDGRHACYVAFVPSGANSGSVLLVDDVGDTGGPFAGITLPGSGTAQNSQCTINGTGSSVTGSGTTLTLTLAVTFNSTYAGNLLFYVAARNNTANSGWQPIGSVSVP